MAHAKCFSIVPLLLAALVLGSEGRSTQESSVATVGGVPAVHDASLAFDEPAVNFDGRTATPACIECLIEVDWESCAVGECWVDVEWGPGMCDNSDPETCYQCPDQGFINAEQCEDPEYFWDELSNYYETGFIYETPLDQGCAAAWNHCWQSVEEARAASDAMRAIAESDPEALLRALQSPMSSVYFNQSRGAIQADDCEGRTVVHVRLTASMTISVTDALGYAHR